ncbi:MAG: hypothetical protein JW850_14040 [Thermoflexales bacterium]|nr:hypothetical protein [Thermoflexales bacterium]
MKLFKSLGLMIVFMLVASGCGSVTSSTSQPAATVEKQDTQDNTLALTDILTDEYEDALSPRNQLALGTLRLEGSPHAVTPEQAHELLLYWQAFKALSADSTSATEETTAVQTQILETLTPNQIAAIKAMQLTNAALNDFYIEQGVEISTPAPGSTPASGVRGKDMTQAEREALRATAEALGTPMASGGGSGGEGSGAERRDILLDAVIALLSQRASE